MKTTNKLIVGLLCMFLFLSGCVKERGTPGKIDGLWERGDIVIQIIEEDEIGNFYYFNYGNWLVAKEEGMVDEWTAKFQDLVRLSETDFTARELWMHIVNGEVVETGWSEVGELRLSEDGRTLFVSTKGPWNGEYSNDTYYRPD